MTYTANHITDKELIALLSTDNQEGLTLLYERHWETMYQFAFYILKDREVCKDIIQDIFVWLWEHRHGLEIQSPKAYLKAAVKFKIANYIRSGKIRESFFEEAVKFNMQDFSVNNNEMAECKELNTIIQNVVQNLPSRCQKIFRLSRENSLSNRAIAEQLGISEKTVENQMTIALRKIKLEVKTYLITGIIVTLSTFI